MIEMCCVNSSLSEFTRLTNVQFEKFVNKKAQS